MATLVTLSSDLNPLNLGSLVTFTATFSVSPQIDTYSPTGSVLFYDGLSALGEAFLVPNAPSSAYATATFTTDALGAGTHSITAVYTGDVNYSGITSSPIVERVDALPSSLTQIVPAFALIATFSPEGDTNIIPAVSFYAVPQITAPGQPITLLWDTMNVQQVEITAAHSSPPFGTGLMVTTGSGAFVIAHGFTSTVTFTIFTYDQDGNPLGVESESTVTIT